MKKTENSSSVNNKIFISGDDLRLFLETKHTFGYEDEQTKTIDGHIYYNYDELVKFYGFKIHFANNGKGRFDGWTYVIGTHPYIDYNLEKGNLHKSTNKLATGGSVNDNLLKEMYKLQRDLSSSRLNTYMQGDNSEEEISRRRERESKLARFNEVLRLLNEIDSKKLNNGEKSMMTKGGGVMSDGKFKLRGFPPIDKVELRGLYDDFKENFSSKIERFTKHLNKVHNSKLRLIDIKELMDYAKMNFVSKGGIVEYHDYKGVEIMYEPTYEEYFVNDMVFNTLEKAQKYIDSGEANETPTYIQNLYRRGAMAKGGSVISKENSIKEFFKKFGFNVEDIQKDEYSNGIEGWIVFYDNKNKYRVIDYSVAMYLIVHDKTTNKTDIIKQSKSFNIDNFAKGGEIKINDNITIKGNKVMANSNDGLYNAGTINEWFEDTKKEVQSILNDKDENGEILYKRIAESDNFIYYTLDFEDFNNAKYKISDVLDYYAVHKASGRGGDWEIWNGLSFMPLQDEFKYGKLNYQHPSLKRLMQQDSYYKSEKKMANGGEVGEFAKGGSVKNGYMVFNYTDNLYATNEVFQTKNDAKRFIDEFKKRFVLQGYYRDSNMNKIDINDVDLYVLDADFNPYKFSEGGIVTYANLDLNTNRNIIAKAIEFISGTGVDAESMTLEGKEIRFKYRTSNTYTTISQKLISDTISTNRKILELRGKNFAKGGSVGMKFNGGGKLADWKKGKFINGKKWYLYKYDNKRWVLEIYKKDDLIDSYYIDLEELENQERGIGKKMYISYSNSQDSGILIPEMVQVKVFNVIKMDNPKLYFGENVYDYQVAYNKFSEEFGYSNGGSVDGGDYVREDLNFYKKGGGIADDNKNKLWYEVLQKFFKIFYGEYEDDTAEKHIKDSQVTTDQAKYYYENFMDKYKTERTLSDGFKIFKQSLTKEELDSIQISFNSEDYADAEEHDTQKRYSTITIKKKENFKKGGSVDEKENNRYWKPINEETLSFYNLTQNSSLQEIDYDDTFLNGKVWIAFKKLPNGVTQIPYEVKMLIKEDFEYYSYGAKGSFIKVSLIEGSWFSMYIDFENLTFKQLEEMLLQLPLQVEERLEDKNIKGYGELGFYDYGKYIELEISNTFSKGGIVVTSIKDIPNFEQRNKENKITYRGLGLGKLFDDFYDIAGEQGTRIKVDGKEYFITNTEFNTFSRDSDGRMRIRFDAPYRKN